MYTLARNVYPSKDSGIFGYVVHSTRAACNIGSNASKAARRCFRIILKRYCGASQSVRPSTLETHGTLR